MHSAVWFDEYESDLGGGAVIDPVNARFKSGVKPEKEGFQSRARTEELVSRSSNVQVNTSEMLENGDDAKVLRVLRGGSWNDRGQDCRSADRYRLAAGNRLSYIGFRLSLGL